MTNGLRDAAESMIDRYRTNTEWSVVRQVVLQCLTATWAEASSVDRICRLAEPLTGQRVEQEDVTRELWRMRAAGLLRRRMVAGVRHYELNLAA